MLGTVSKLESLCELLFERITDLGLGLIEQLMHLDEGRVYDICTKLEELVKCLLALITCIEIREGTCCEK